MFKKVISIMLALVLMSTCAFAQGFSDIMQSRQKNAIDALYGMGLVKGDGNGSFNPEANITRMEFLAMVLRMIGLEDAAKASEGSDLPFTDVPVDHWGRGYAYWAYTTGITEGISATQFGPGDNVTYNQAAKMIVSALGWSIAAEKMGGWPNGYLVKAAQMDILDGIESGERPLKREEVARLIFNALTVPMMEELNGEYTEGDDALTRLGCKKYNGTVTSTYDTQTGATLTENMVEISGTRYKTTYFVEGALLGANVVFYTTDKDGEEVICLVYERYKGETIEVNARDILDGTTLSSFIYRLNGKTRQESLPGGSLRVVYNGKSVGSLYMTDDILKPESGKVLLRDSDNNGIYDTAIVTEYTTIVAAAVSEYNVYDKYGNNIDIDIDEEQIKVYLYGKEASLSDITAGDILSVSKSIDGEKIVININRDSFTGTVITRDDENDTYGIELDGQEEEYYLAPEYKAAIAAKKAGAEKFELGDSGIFYTNIEGEIAYCTLTGRSDDTAYGYLLAAAENSGIGGSASFKILTLNNKFTVFETPKNGKINFGRTVGSDYVYSKVNPREVVDYVAYYVEDTYVFEKQICTYKLNEEGEITDIQFADTRGHNAKYLSRNFAPQSMNYTTKLLNQTYIVDENTAVFYIPNSGQYEDIMAAGKYNKFLSTGRVNVALYDIEDSHVGALVYLPLSIERYDNGIGEYETIIDNVNSPVLYIQKTSYVNDENGDSYLNLTGIEDGETVNIKVADELSGISEDRSRLKAGVAIQYEMNDLTRGRALTSDDEELLIVFKVVHDFTSSNNTLNTMTYNYSTSYQSKPKISVMYTTLTAVYPSFVQTAIEDKVAPFTGGTVYMRYNASSNEKFELITPLDLSIGQKVVIRQRYLNTREIVVVEE